MQRGVWALGAIALIMAVWGWLRAGRAQGELDALRAQLSTDRAARAAWRARIEGLEARLRDVETRTPDGAPGAGVALGAPRARPVATDDGDRPLDLAAAVAQRVEAKVEARLKAVEEKANRRGPGGEWQAPIDALAKEIALRPEQREPVVEIFNGARDDTFAILNTQREDGTSLLDDLADALRDGPPEDAMRDFFQKMVESKVPGTDRSYLSDLMAVRRQVMESLGEHLDPTQIRQMQALHVDPLNVQTGYDPAREYVESRLEK